jgi:peptidoglycan/xylan/chitin deacetylase (PgdA/CDA1 family)
MSTVTRPAHADASDADGHALILTFHGIGPVPRPFDPGEDQVWLDCDAFKRILDVVVDQPHVEITFDDGNASDLEHAVPALRERGLRATFFVLAGRLNEPAFLTPGELCRLCDEGMGLGSHGMSHTPWRRLDTQRAAEEIDHAKAELEALVGRSISQAACPFGAYDRRSLALARAAGFDTVFTSDGGVSRRDQWLRPRNTVHVDDSPASVRRLLRMRSFDLPDWKRRAKTLVKRLR